MLVVKTGIEVLRQKSKVKDKSQKPRPKTKVKVKSMALPVVLTVHMPLTVGDDDDRHLPGR